MPEVTLQQAFDLAQRHQQAGNIGQAEELYRQILAHLPAEPQVLQMLGLLCYQSGRIMEASDLFARSIAADPKSAPSRCNYALALLALDRTDEAIAAARSSLRIDSSFAETHNTLGTALQRKGDLPGACQAYADAIKAGPHCIPAYVNLGAALRQLGNIDDAIAAYQAALARDPASIHALINLGAAFKDRGQLNDAMQTYDRALQYHPGNAFAHSSIIYLHYFHPDSSAETIRQAEARFDRQFEITPLPVAVPRDPNPDRKLRVGYLSPDFCDHVIGRNILPLLRNHDRSRFEITCYYNSRKSDALTGQFRSLAHHWRPIVGMSDQAVAQLIAADQIDILVDLTLHMANNRLLALARQPAPVQITFAGYPGSTGLRAVDYRLTDPHLDPPGTDHLYSERSIRLPDSFWCYDPLGEAPPVNTLPASAGGGVTFGCFNNFCKINDPVLRLWNRVLDSVPNSRLILLCPPGSHRKRLLEQFGSNASRVELANPRPRPEYLKLFHRIDIALDTFPYNGHTTSLDGFYMGVPTITLRGKTIAGRAGVSQLTNLGLTELIAETEDQYIDIAQALANDLPRLADLRSTLRQRMERSPLMNAKQFAAGIEAAYEQAWKRAIASCD